MDPSVNEIHIKPSSSQADKDPPQGSFLVWIHGQPCEGANTGAKETLCLLQGKKQYPSPKLRKGFGFFFFFLKYNTKHLSPQSPSTAPDFKRGHKSAQVSSFIPLLLSNYTNGKYDLKLAQANVFGAFMGPTGLTPSVAIIAEAQQSASQQKLETF